MEQTNGLVWDTNAALADIADKAERSVVRLPAKVSYGLARNRQVFSPIIEAIVEARTGLLGDCDAVDDAGQPKTKNDGREFDIPKDRLAEYQAGWKDLRDMEAEFKPYVIPIAYFDDSTGLTPIHFEAMLMAGIVSED